MLYRSYNSDMGRVTAAKRPPPPPLDEPLTRLGDNGLSDAQIAHIESFGVPVVQLREHRSFYLAGICVDSSVMPSDREIQQVRSYMEFIARRVYEGAAKRILAMPRPGIGGHNTVILVKGALYKGSRQPTKGWTYRRESWEVGPAGRADRDAEAPGVAPGDIRHGAVQERGVASVDHRGDPPAGETPCGADDQPHRLRPSGGEIMRIMSVDVRCADRNERVRAFMKSDATHLVFTDGSTTERSVTDEALREEMRASFHPAWVGLTGVMYGAMKWLVGERRTKPASMATWRALARRGLVGFVRQRDLTDRRELTALGLKLLVRRGVVHPDSKVPTAEEAGA